MTVTVWLIWTLVAGVPQDVDSFLFEGACKESLQLGKDTLASAIKQTQREDLKNIELLGCLPVQLGAPGVAKN